MSDRLRTTIRVSVVLVVGAMHAGSVHAESPNTEAPDMDAHAVVRGMTVSCQTWGWEWGTDGMVEAMRELRDLGVNWITIHPYARIQADGAVGTRRLGTGETDWLERPIAEAKRLDMKMFIKPHLAYWGSPFRWRGDIVFETDAQWERFFKTYQAWIVSVAEVCRDADALAVGTELDRTLEHEHAWRGVIRGVRGAFDGPLTYAANWSDFERVPFWDDLDAIGIQGYFPLVDHDARPTAGEIEQGWKTIMTRLEAFAAHHDRDIILTELGYNRSGKAAQMPWDYREGGPHAEDTQAACLQAALHALRGGRRVRGAFLWKWFAGPTTHENFLMSTPRMREVIRGSWAS